MHEWRSGKAERGKVDRFFPARAERAKKEEFPGAMGNMPPGNSFPQICVVSVNHSVENESSKCGQY
jgi:hypothetical protein